MYRQLYSFCIKIMFRPFRSRWFWIGCIVAGCITTLFFAWERESFAGFLPAPPPSTFAADSWYTILLLILLSLNAGMITWRTHEGSCPRGTKRASGLAGVLGAFTLICPVCIVLPASVFGLGIIATFIAPFLPLLRLIAIVLLAVSLWLLIPKQKT